MTLGKKSQHSAGCGCSSIGSMLARQSSVPWVHSQDYMKWGCCCTPAVYALGMQSQEDQEHKVTFGHIANWRPA